MEPSDIRYAYGAYMIGGFSEDLFPKGMTPKQFTELFFDRTDLFDMEHVVEFSGRPIGIIAAHGNEDVFEPHAHWFSWATPRQILQGSAKYLDKMRQHRWGVIHIPEERKNFMLHLAKYGLVRPVGKFDHHPKGRSYVYETITR